jgi:hypothetical protein
MANFFAVINSQANQGSEEAERKFKSAKILEQPKEARFVKMEAGSIAEAQEALRVLYPGNASGTPVVVAESAWKES